ncbi:MAG: hypothetical protein H6649_08525 [Caldilineae bacterium]|nr:hypothetical protein [Anaerolineae bacterium]MCB0200136.1 hypothetical protein [Anaerolineae bacterium]MCB0203655.1 hypothetical protein [Anaerolineae bacterium]MCB0255906.1 hypothetical protein [Anaerolineae bacterium]MCB9154084.1 hypothetical protein [Caldilineae bacterium]
MTSETVPSTRLRQPWLNFTRILWIVVAGLSLLVALVSIAISLREPLPSCVNPEAVCGPWSITREDVALADQLGLSASLVLDYFFAVSIAIKLAFIGVGLLIFLRRSDDWMAQLLSLMLVTFAVEGIQNLGPAMPLVSALYAIPGVVFVLLPFIFPNGRFVPRWTKWVLPLILLLTVPITLLPTIVGVVVSTNLFSLLTLLGFGLWIVLAAYAAVYRYRRVSSPAEKQQTKWVVGGFLASCLLFVPFAMVTVWFPPDTQTPQRLAFMLLVFLPLYMFCYLAIPAGVAFAILRYRLWDIDVIVRKTLVYASLTALLALVFFGVVTLLSSLFSAVSGQQSALAIVISTLVIAALFTPLRRRLQAGIDRRFFRRKYNAQQVLARFALTARDETDLDALTAELVNVVQETMQPDRVSVWLRKQ